MVPPQDAAPVGGFPTTIRYKRSLPKRGPSGALILAAAFGIMGYGELKKENTWARVYLVPLLEAELDRDMVRRMEAVKQREAAIMPEGWKAGDLKAPIEALGNKPVYHTERYVQPSLVFLPKDEESFIDAQIWRGSKVFTKNPPYHDREDFTKEHPIGK